MDLDAEWRERLAPCTLGVQNVLNTGAKLPPFPVAVAVLPQGLAPALVSEQLVRGADRAERRGSRLVGERVRPPGTGIPRQPPEHPGTLSTNPSIAFVPPS